MPLNGQLQPIVLRWDPSPSSDVVGYRLYYSGTSDISDYDGPNIDVGDATEFDVAQLGLADGEYWFTAIPYDEKGHLGAGAEAGPFELDLTVPEPAGAVEEVVG